MNALIHLPEWQALKDHFEAISDTAMQEWFAENPDRFHQLSLTHQEFLLDFSKNRLTAETQQLLCALAYKTGLSEKITALFEGHTLNYTEKRPALHTALRHPANKKTVVQRDLINDIQAVLTKMTHFTEAVRNKQWLGATGKPITDIVNIGIGGSHLGPLMVVHALADYAHESLRCHFISNIDSAHVNAILKHVKAETTLFIISSKSFTTLETLFNARKVCQWLEAELPTADLTQHLVAVTAHPSRAIAFGVSENNIFRLWEWVGGRYSIWSAIGLPVALLIGMHNFSTFLQGAHDMDLHFQEKPFSENMPVMLALIGIWYINFFGVKHQAIVPYSHHLHYFRVHLQQLDMESNGKLMSIGGNPVKTATGPVIFGEQGCNGQHAFHQLLHQGQHLIPVDFILLGKESAHLDPHHAILIGSGLSQAEALMKGKSFSEALAELTDENLSADERKFLAQHKIIPGNRPSNIIFIDRMTPYNLGWLLAMYEHKIFVQGAIWGINSFDQWGVELGKQLLPSILNDLKHDTLGDKNNYDGSTQGLIQHYLKLRNKSYEN